MPILDTVAAYFAQASIDHQVDDRDVRRVAAHTERDQAFNSQWCRRPTPMGLAILKPRVTMMHTASVSMPVPVRRSDCISSDRAKHTVQPGAAVVDSA